MTGRSPFRPAMPSPGAIEEACRIGACMPDDWMYLPGTTIQQLRAMCLPEHREELERILAPVTPSPAPAPRGDAGAEPEASPAPATASLG